MTSTSEPLPIDSPGETSRANLMAELRAAADRLYDGEPSDLVPSFVQRDKG